MQVAVPVPRETRFVWELSVTQHPPRVAWTAFPDVILLAGEMAVKRHPGYSRAKAGNAIAARRLVEDLVDETRIAAVQELVITVSKQGLPVLKCIPFDTKNFGKRLIRSCQRVLTGTPTPKTRGLKRNAH